LSPDGNLQAPSRLPRTENIAQRALCLAGVVQSVFVSKSILANVGWRLAERSLRLGIVFAVTLWVARVLGPGQFGLFGYAQSLVAILGFLGTLGLEGVAVRELARRPEQRATILGSALTLRLTGGLLLIAVAAIAASSMRPSLPVPLVALLAGASLLQATEVLDYWVQHEMGARYSAPAKLLALSGGVGLRLWAVGTASPVAALAAAVLAESALTGIAIAWAHVRVGGRLRALRPDVRELRLLVAESWPLLGASIAVAVYARADVLLLGHFCSRVEIGRYAVAAAISEAFYFVPVGVMMCYAPILAAQRTGQPQRTSTEQVQVLFWLSRSGAVLAAAVTLVAGWLLPAALGGSYVESVRMLRIHVWSTLFVFVSVASEPWIVNRHLQHLYLRKASIAAAVNIALNLALIPRWGGVGAALATLASYSVSAFWTNALWPETRALFSLQARALLFCPWRRAVRGVELP
jgi:polysaccharide transporter, PST family